MAGFSALQVSHLSGRGCVRNSLSELAQAASQQTAAMKKAQAKDTEAPGAGKCYACFGARHLVEALKDWVALVLSEMRRPPWQKSRSI